MSAGVQKKLLDRCKLTCDTCVKGANVYVCMCLCELLQVRQ